MYKVAVNLSNNARFSWQNYGSDPFSYLCSFPLFLGKQECLFVFP